MVGVPAPELDLDLDTFEGPFDLLLTLILKEELRLAEVDVADIVRSFAGTLPEHIDLEASGEFLVLVGALLEIKARELFPDVDADVSDLSPSEAAEELAARLAEYRRIKAAAGWLAQRLDAEADRFYRTGPAPIAPRTEIRVAPQDPLALAGAIRSLAAEPPEVSLSHMQLHFPPVARFLDRFRALLERRARFMFDDEVATLTRLEQASAFLALLELRKRSELELDQDAAFAPIGVRRVGVEREAA